MRYGVAVLVVGAAVLIKLLLDPLTAQDTPFLLILGAIMVGAWYGGLGPGLLATALSALAIDYFFLDPRVSFTTAGPELLDLGAFVVEGILVCVLTASLRSARDRAERSTLEAQSHQENLREGEERFRFLAASGATLTSSLDYRTTLANVAGLAVPTLADWCAVDVLEEDGSVERLAVEHSDPEKVALAFELQERSPSNPDTTRGVRKVLETGEPDMMEEIPEELLDQVAVDASTGR